jgi:mono/diheme cytochrome c family protein
MNERMHYFLGPLLVMSGLAALAGCGSPAADFRRYETYAHKVSSSGGFEFTATQRQDIDEALQALFGTPDQPLVPAVEGIGKVVSSSRLKLAAGPVGSDEQGNPRGLYREHCAHCHGISGDGVGPTAGFLNPYPRDYRLGKFKFKSTPLGQRPSHADLKKIVLDGIPGTAMPSFKLLLDLEVEALVDYVKYLSIRGEVERRLLIATGDLEPNVRLVSTVAANANAEEKAAQQQQVAAVKDIVTEIVGKWESAAGASVEIPPRPSMTKDELVASIKHGRDLFYGSAANCVQCHGDSALGDGRTNEFDDWVKDLYDPLKEGDRSKEFVARGLLPPRPIKPRNLRQGVFRGGLRPIDIYWRIRNGIEGTPMPAATMKPEGDPNAKGLTATDIWDIVNYVQSLAYEPINNPLDAAHEVQNLRERL